MDKKFLNCCVTKHSLLLLLLASLTFGYTSERGGDTEIVSGALESS